ncbi:electron transporter RnfC [Chloroflexota bacterium]
MAENANKWPEFSIFNQEGRRFAQNQYGLIDSDGQATYFERFSVVIHDTTMDYSKYPFDSQEFSIVIDSLFPGESHVYTPNDTFNEVGGELGEEEWIITSFSTEVSATPDFGSRFSFIFPATRHLDYYILRIFIPLFLILLVSWGTFFLRDYGLRISLAGANLLLFVAFNFTLGEDLPRLGYVTFLDAILMMMFLMTSLVIFYNFILRAWESGGKGERVLFVDKFAVYAYLILYCIAILVIVLVYLV